MLRSAGPNSRLEEFAEARLEEMEEIGPSKGRWAGIVLLFRKAVRILVTQFLVSVSAGFLSTSYHLCIV